MSKFNLPHVLIYLLKTLIVQKCWWSGDRHQDRFIGSSYGFIGEDNLFGGKQSRQASGFANSSEATAFKKHEINFCLVAFPEPDTWLLIWMFLFKLLGVIKITASCRRQRKHCSPFLGLILERIWAHALCTCLTPSVWYKHSTVSFVYQIMFFLMKFHYIYGLGIFLKDCKTKKPVELVNKL